MTGSGGLKVIRLKRLSIPAYLYIFLLFTLLTAGCLPIDYTPIDQQSSYHRTEQAPKAVSLKGPAEHPPGPFRIGTAKIEITPPVGFPMAAYGGRRSKGVHDPIMARAIAISDSRETIVLVSVELLAVTDDFYSAVYRNVRGAIPLPEDDFMIAATHTHSGPGSLGKRFWESLAAGPYNDGIFEMTTDRVAQAVIRAYRHLQPAAIEYGRIDAGDRILNRMIKGGPTDPDLSYLVFKTPENRTLAYLINFSAHPTVLRSENRLLSGDFPGVVSRDLEGQANPEDPEIVALYTSGALADQRAHPPDGKGVFERAERMGRDLAERVLKSAPGSPDLTAGVVTGTKLSLRLPDPQIKVGQTHRLPIWMGRALLDGNTSIQIFRIGPMLLIGVPCDLGSEIGLALKGHAHAKGFHAIIVGFANDYVGYVIPDKYYAGPFYEAFMSFNGPYMEDFMTSEVENIMDRLQPDQDTSKR